MGDPRVKAFVLILLLWSTERSETVTAEFNSLETCQAAAQQSKKVFGGYNTSVYFVCSEK